ncbi:unnamed protein product [Hermetia illucens]|uniref:Uncharacterized protein n=1 Tax=Hermetia illucens TaxID=343691 RepID=A0A7R8UMC5_HERIL|nr:unnamed protein product [Hermetia illucens]
MRCVDGLTRLINVVRVDGPQVEIPPESLVCGTTQGPGVGNPINCLSSHWGFSRKSYLPEPVVEFAQIDILQKVKLPKMYAQ